MRKIESYGERTNVTAGGDYGWLGEGKLRVAFRWSGADDARFEGTYTFNVAAGAIDDVRRDTR
ncbi:hypothetical protein [Paenibacillus sp. NEAU-GSW1]|uniref:hypothetical protein n=1 Tax=Paenibacillus sp. NEAU-GSW1 TaxID=2682486 RepID=UPI0012E0F3F4|nr:hypothetical protein [Paenibacillus sp. NEAU-GSW1]MUT64643.1 hypothetical protein [Paenibacillus sp. NEAU-GSW1]